MSKIEWTDETWNPIVGCSVTSPGCTNCYAMRMAGRLEAMGVDHYAGLTQKSRAGAVWTGKLAMAPDITAPLRWRKPRRVFVNSMGDLFHEDVPDEWIDQVFAIMALAPQHTFQVLTKRAGRVRSYVTSRASGGTSAIVAATALDNSAWLPRELAVKSEPQFQNVWPLPNVWLGASVEDQERADQRIPDLLATPAAVRFLSCEPLIEPVDLHNIQAPNDDDDLGWKFDALATGDTYVFRDDMGIWESGDGPMRETSIDWVIVGGESGPKARPMHPDWARTLRDQCAYAGVPFFFKQWGEWGIAHGYPSEAKGKFAMMARDPGGWTHTSAVMLDHYPRQFEAFGSVILERHGKKAAGRLLDGVKHNGFPTTPAQEART